MNKQINESITQDSQKNWAKVLKSKKAAFALTALNIMLLAFLVLTTSLSVTQAASLIERVKGRILLQVQQKGEAWYVNPVDEKRYYLGRPNDAFEIMRNLGLGITDSDLSQIPVGDIGTANWQTYVNKNINFNINYPKDWTYKEGLEFDYAFHVFFSEGSSEFGILPKGELDHELPKDKPTEKNITIDGNNAIRKDWTLDNDNVLIVINFSSYPSSWNEDNRIEIFGPQDNIEVFNEMIDSIKFVD